MNRTRATSSAIILLLCLSGILLIPIPHYVRCPFTIEPQAAENVYVDVPGTVRSVHVKQGEYVRREQPILNLKNDELALQLLSSGRSNSDQQDQIRHATAGLAFCR